MSQGDRVQVREAECETQRQSASQGDRVQDREVSDDTQRLKQNQPEAK